MTMLKILMFLWTIGWSFDFARAAENSESESLLEKNFKHPVHLDVSPSHLKLNHNGTYLAYVPSDGTGLRILNLKTSKISEPSGFYIGGSFFWSPDGLRIFYRELRRESDKTKSFIRSWDVVQNKNIEIEQFDGSSGFLTFDPRDYRLLVMYAGGVKSKKLVFPDNRLAEWQVAQKKDLGKWLFAQKSGIYLTESGFKISKLNDDGSGIESFDLLPDGSSAVWATKSGKIYLSSKGQDPQFLDWGRDPRWHPRSPMLVYAGGRMVGSKASDYDLKIVSIGSKPSFLTATQGISERWPQWSPDGEFILFNIEGTPEIRLHHFETQVKPLAKSDLKRSDVNTRKQ